VAFERMCGKCNYLLDPPPKPQDSTWIDELRKASK
jgi:hypothetical protein